MTKEDLGQVTGYSFRWSDYMITCRKCQSQLFVLDDKRSPMFYCDKCKIFYNGKEGFETVKINE